MPSSTIASSSTAHPYRPDAPAAALLRGARTLRPARAIELLIALALVVAVDVSFWNESTWGTGGFGLALFFSLAPMLFLVAARRTRLNGRLLVIGALLALTALRSAYLPTPATTISGLALLFAFTVALRGRGASIPALGGSFLHAWNYPARLAVILTGAREQLRRTRVGRLPLAPILVPLALVALFAGVFALANPVVARGLERALEIVERWIAIPSFLRVLLWLCAIVFGAMLLRPALFLSRPRAIDAGAVAATPTSLKVARNALLALNVLFLGYNVLDAAYLWAGAPPPGVTTQQYAHAGAAWLTVALVALTLVVGVMFRATLAHDDRARLARLLAFAWLGQGFVLAVGTYRRMAMHIAWSGLSNLRIVGILGTTLVVVGLVLVGAKLHRRRSFSWLLRHQLDAFALTFVLFAVMPTHLISAHVNVARIAGGEQRPLLHMIRQAAETESVASLVPLLEHDDLRIRQGIASLLVVERDRLRAEVANVHHWREEDFASRRAFAVLDRATPRLESVLAGVSKDAARSDLWSLIHAAEAAD